MTISLLFQQVLLPCVSVVQVLIKVKCVVSCVKVSPLEVVCGETAMSIAMSLSVQISTNVKIPYSVEEALMEWVVVNSASTPLGGHLCIRFPDMGR